MIVKVILMVVESAMTMMMTIMEKVIIIQIIPTNFGLRYCDDGDDLSWR